MLFRHSSLNETATPVKQDANFLANYYRSLIFSRPAWNVRVPKQFSTRNQSYLQAISNTSIDAVSCSKAEFSYRAEPLLQCLHPKTGKQSSAWSTERILAVIKRLRTCHTSVLENMSYFSAFITYSALNICWCRVDFSQPPYHPLGWQ